MFAGEHTAYGVLAGSQEVRGSNPLGSTSRGNAVRSEHKDVTDPTMIRVILRVKDNPGWDYWGSWNAACVGPAGRFRTMPRRA